MGQINTERLSHDIDTLPNTFRDDQVNQIINDLYEDVIGAGYLEVSYVGSTPFVDKLTVWDSASKLKKRVEAVISYSPSPFVSQIVQSYYSEDGLSVISVVTTTISYNANKTVNTISTITVRP